MHVPPASPEIRGEIKLHYTYVIWYPELWVVDEVGGSLNI